MALRFPLPGKSSQAHLDEKVAGEISALQLLRARTNVPIPEVRAWARSLPIGSPDRRPPLTLAAHEIMCRGGVDVLAKEFFDYLVNQQWQQLHEQLTSACDEANAREKYIFFRPDYNEGPFKLSCDDFSPRNTRAQDDDLKITGVIDQEFSYTRPAQLLATAAWWLLLERPHMWDFSQEMEDRFLRHLDMFKRVLEEEEEEEATLGQHEEDKKKFSRLMERSCNNEDGTMW
ncbi:hypothetical protein B0H63DRAFT_453998 [Podospora didyma]|uniref:Phosphotransferase enzyme family protein n=1 Tax=Podospora didyma TaxID=330526 RepID=A0AAE0KA63_9PEZI|nr:hypothetical protein B0H63DRAFT_453998 [Podospora didyma]